MTDPGTNRRDAAREAFGVLLLSRALVWFVAVFAALKLAPSASGNERIYDQAEDSHPFGGWPLEHVFDAIFSPLARWDAIHYLTIANDGYDAPDDDLRHGFFPLYPMTVRAVAGWTGSNGLTLIAAHLVSLAAFGVALYLLHRLVELELGRDRARTTLLLLAVFPASLYYGAPYSESMFLAVTVGAFYCARTERWALAGALAGLASAARIPGLLLVVPLVALYLYGPRGRGGPTPGTHGAPWWRPRFRPDRRVAWLALAPTGALAFAGLQKAETGDALGWLTTVNQGQKRNIGLPLEGAVEALRAAGAGALDIARGTADTFPAQANLTDVAFMVFAVVATIGVLRRLPLAYGVYAIALLFLPLSTPLGGEPIGGFPRYMAVVFPLFMWLAIWCDERGLTTRAVVVSAVLLGAFTSQFATWQWVA